MSFWSNLFGGSAPQINYTPSGFTSSGVSANYRGGNFKLSESPALSSAVGSLQSTFGQEAGAFGALGRTVAPGFSQFRQAGLRDITNTFAAARSNLSDVLAQRRLSGSSFANSQLSQQAADEAQAKANFEAQAYLSELDASNKLIAEQFTASTSQFTTAINQMNLEADLGAKLSTNASTALASVSTAQAELDAKAAAGAGQFFGSILGAGTGGGNTVAGSVFGGATGFLGNVGDYIAGGGAETLGPLMAGGLVLP